MFVSKSLDSPLVMLVCTQIIISMAVGMFMASSMFDAPPQTGAFVGGLLSMSSTSIVVKCLESLRWVPMSSPSTQLLTVNEACVAHEQHVYSFQLIRRPAVGAHEQHGMPTRLLTVNEACIAHEQHVQSCQVLRKPAVGAHERRSMHAQLLTAQGAACISSSSCGCTRRTHMLVSNVCIN